MEIFHLMFAMYSSLVFLVFLIDYYKDNKNKALHLVCLIMASVTSALWAAYIVYYN